MLENLVIQMNDTLMSNTIKALRADSTTNVIVVEAVPQSGETTSIICNTLLFLMLILAVTFILWKLLENYFALSHQRLKNTEDQNIRKWKRNTELQDKLLDHLKVDKNSEDNHVEYEKTLKDYINK